MYTIDGDNKVLHFKIDLRIIKIDEKNRHY
jgi:hypothetical protein